MDGKVCLVTGATAGIGLVTATELARRGATVVLVGRSAERGREAVASVRADSGNPDVIFLPADLSSLAEVRELARQFLARHDHLDVLVNNCGAIFATRRTTADGHEMTLALNHLGPFLLTNLLLDALKRAAPSRIVTLSSAAHADVAGFDFDDPQAARTAGPGRYPRSEWSSVFHSLTRPWAHPGFLQYARSKLANLLFTAELARRLAGTGVTANAVNPGLVASNFSAGNGVYGWFMRRYANRKGIPVEQGAATPVFVATAPELSEVTGQYFFEGRAAPWAASADDAVAAARLWQLSESLTGLRPG